MNHTFPTMEVASYPTVLSFAVNFIISFVAVFLNPCVESILVLFFVCRSSSVTSIQVGENC